MPAKDIVAQNLRAWMEFAASRGYPTGSAKGLAKVSGISRPTIADMRNGVSGCGVDTLEAVAAAYGLMAWQMLVAGIDPPDKPVLGNEEAIEAEVSRRAARLVKMQASLQVSDEKARSGPSVAYPFGPVQDARAEPPDPKGSRTAKAAGGRARAKKA
jgi:hypothetical protein